jgi:predicted SprT family Zn-dependent metalloprotease
MEGPIGEYESFQIAYDHFNATLFEGRLPLCLITMRISNKKAYGYFSPERFTTRDNNGLLINIVDNKDKYTDEIALNPETFGGRTDFDILSTLAHEMVHLHQHHFGKKSRAGYHDKAWGKAMKVIGLHPSDTGAVGGKEIGQQMTHYVIEGGPYDISCKELLDAGFKLEWQALTPLAPEKKAKKNKVTYTCPSCQQNAWAKPGAKLKCGECDELMRGDDDDEAE